MFAKVLLVCSVATVALAIDYPPGLNPAVCPNYPHCDAEVLARHTPEGFPIPDWDLPTARMRSAAAFLRLAEAIPARYPADFDPALCPNYPYCDMEVLARHTPQGIPIPDWEMPYARMVAPVPVVAPVSVEPAAAKYPADVDPASCPNYPYCV